MGQVISFSGSSGKFAFFTNRKIVTGPKIDHLQEMGWARTPLLESGLFVS